MYAVHPEHCTYLIFTVIFRVTWTANEYVILYSLQRKLVKLQNFLHMDLLQNNQKLKFILSNKSLYIFLENGGFHRFLNSWIFRTIFWSAFLLSCVLNLSFCLHVEHLLSLPDSTRLWNPLHVVRSLFLNENCVKIVFFNSTALAR